MNRSRISILCGVLLLCVWGIWWKVTQTERIMKRMAQGVREVCEVESGPPERLALLSQVNTLNNILSKEIEVELTEQSGFSKQAKQALNYASLQELIPAILVLTKELKVSIEVEQIMRKEKAIQAVWAIEAKGISTTGAQSTEKGRVLVTLKQNQEGQWQIAQIRDIVRQ